MKSEPKFYHLFSFDGKSKSLYGWNVYAAIILSLYMKFYCVWIYLPRQLALVGHGVVAFCIKYALSVVKDGLFRKVSSSFFQTYVICDNSYDTDDMLIKYGHQTGFIRPRWYTKKPEIEVKITE